MYLVTLIFLVSLALAARLRKCNRFFCVCVGVPKGVSWSQALVAETVETGDKNRDVSQRHALFCEEKLLAGNSVSCRINRLFNFLSNLQASKTLSFFNSVLVISNVFSFPLHPRVD